MRLALGLLLAILVNFGLFTLMQKMTAEQNIERQVTENIQLLDFVRLKREDKAETKKRELPKKLPPPKKPPPPKTPAQQVDKPKSPSPKLDVPRIDVPLNIAGGPYLGDFSNAPVAQIEPAVIAAPTMDDDVMPLVRIPPRYPRMASRRGIEGVVTISFTITKDGRVRDPVVINAKPENIFDSAALKAILKWKFKPKSVDGQPVERQATQEIEFKLAK
ncbi:MAG: protein TonB [Methylophagaceae bacterium]|jgi:protein TonB